MPYLQLDIKTFELIESKVRLEVLIKIYNEDKVLLFESLYSTIETMAGLDAVYANLKSFITAQYTSYIEKRRKEMELRAVLKRTLNRIELEFTEI